MSNKILLFGAIILVAFAAGRYTAENTTTTKTQETKQVDKDIRTRTETTTVKQKDGSIKTITTTDRVSNTTVKSEKIDSITMKNRSKINVSLLAAYDFSTKNKLTGISVTKTVGPVSLGVFGLSGNDETIGGISAGLEF